MEQADEAIVVVAHVLQDEAALNLIRRSETAAASTR